MMADDIANNPLNPHPGKIFNKPGGQDVYEGVPKVNIQAGWQAGRHQHASKEQSAPQAG